MSQTSDALVIGGGLHGLSAALQLARRGVSVRLLERVRIGRHSSGASAAGVRTLGRDRAELPASIVAMEMWRDMKGLVGDDCGFRPYGQLLVAENETELAELRSKVAALVRDGFTNEEMVDVATLRELAPPLAHHCVGGIFAAGDGAADPHQTLAAYYRSCVDAGVIIHEGVGVSSLRWQNDTWSATTNTETFEAPLVVNAAGAWAGYIAASAGDDIPLDTKASMMIVTERVEPYIRPTVGAAGRALSFKQTAQGTLLIGGGQQGRADLANETTEIDTRALAKAAAAATALFPGVGRLRINRAWAGLEAKTTDYIAIAGLSASAPNLMHLFGFCGHGFQLVPALGVASADLLLDGETAIDIENLSPRRFLTNNGPLISPSGNIGPLAQTSESGTTEAYPSATSRAV